HDNSDRSRVGPQLTQQPQPLRLEVENKRAYPRNVTAGAIEAGDETACRFRKLYPFDFAVTDESEHDRRMIAIGLLFARMLRDFFKPRPRLEAEILILRHQLNVLQQRTPRRRLHLRWVDRALFIWLYRRYPRILDALSIVRPETV